MPISDLPPEALRCNLVGEIAWALFHLKSEPPRGAARRKDPTREAVYRRARTESFDRLRTLVLQDVRGLIELHPDLAAHVDQSALAAMTLCDLADLEEGWVRTRLEARRFAEGELAPR